MRFLKMAMGGRTAGEDAKEEVMLTLAHLALCFGTQPARCLSRMDMAFGTLEGIRQKLRAWNSNTLLIRDREKKPTQSVVCSREKSILTVSWQLDCLGAGRLLPG